MDNQTRNHLNLQKHIADQDHIIRVRNAEITALRKRAEKAEKERDEVGEMAASLRSQLAEALDRAEQPRPLTPDAITDEMVERAARANGHTRNLTGILRQHFRRVLAAALTEPTRPEGAEEMADDMEDCLRDVKLEDVGLDGLADHLTAMGYRKEQNR